MRKGIFLISLLICLVIAPCVVMLQPSTSTAYGVFQGLTISSKDIHSNITLYGQNSDNPIHIPIQSGWEINSINMTFNNIRAPNSTLTLEENAFAAYRISIYRAMSFQLPENQTAYLNSISLYLLQFPLDLPWADMPINMSLYNASFNASIGGPYPDKLINSTIIYFPWWTGPVGWKDLPLTSPFEIDPRVDKTFNKTFFIVVRNGTLPYHSLLLGYYGLWWFFAPDNETANIDQGYAYNSTDLANWNLEKSSTSTIDYGLKVHVSVNDTAPYWETPLPNEINMKVNGTAVEDLSRGSGFCNLYQDLNISDDTAVLIFNTSWNQLNPVIFDVKIEIYGINVAAIHFRQTLRSLTMMFTNYTFMKDNQDKLFILLGFIALGAVVAGSYGGRRSYKRRQIPRNALRAMENILVDHNRAGIMIWSFDFISMQQDVALISGFMTAIKSFLEEMKVGGLKRLGTEFGTFIREESQQLTATCITSDIGLDEELWIRGKLHEFLIQIEQKHYKQLEEFKGDVAQFRESFPVILASLIDLNKVQKLQRQKIEKLSKNKDKVQKKVNKYGAKLEALKSKYDSGEIGFKKYIIERYKTEAKYDKVQKDYLYASLFLSRTPFLLEAKPLTPKDMEKMEKIQSRFLEIRGEIDKLRIKEWEGTITSKDIERKAELQKELMALMEKLDKLRKT